jgi:hypothetical protein
VKLFGTGREFTVEGAEETCGKYRYRKYLFCPGNLILIQFILKIRRKLEGREKI